MRLVLATKSKSVAKALHEAGYDFEMKSVTLCTDGPKNTQPGMIALQTALDQLTAVSSKTAVGEQITVLSHESMLVCQDEVLDFPKTKFGENSASRLKSYLARYASFPVRVYSAIAVKNMVNNKRVGSYKVTEIVLKPFTSAEMNALSLDDNCYESVGGLAFNSSNIKTRQLLLKHIASIDGEMTDVTSVPLSLVNKSLSEVGYSKNLE